jgi:tRNA threonylcarbamoyladenosine modification (KEOPS) complex  Pcc1 subunit
MSPATGATLFSSPPSGEFSADLEVAFDSEREARVAYEALLPEFSSEFPRVKRAFKIKGSKILLRLDAKDPASLRAGLNSYMRWMKTSIEVQGVARNALLPGGVN